MAEAKAFFSYRRNFDGDISGRISDWIVKTFGGDSIFFDVDNIPIGTDFRRHIENSIDRSNVVLVAIGKQWLSATNPDGTRRLDDPNDFVRIEIERAFAQGVPVVPILLDGATMPDEKSLPETMRQLPYQHALEVRSGADFSITIHRLLTVLERQWGFRRLETGKLMSRTIMIIGIIATILGSLGVVGIWAITLFDAPPPTVVTVYDGVGGWAFLTFLFALGPPLIVWGCWLGCVQASSRENQLFFAPGVEVRKKSGKAIVCLALGLASIPLGLVASIPAIIFGILGWIELKKKAHLLRGWHLLLQGLAYGVVFGTLTTYFHYVLWTITCSNLAIIRSQEALRTNQITVAAEQASKAIAYCPSGIFARRVRGMVAYRQGKVAEALPDLDYALASYRLPSLNPVLNTHMAETLVYRSNCNEQLQNPEAAQKDLELARQLDANMTQDTVDELSRWASRAAVSPPASSGSK